MFIIVKQIEDAMSSEERRKMFEAIGYSEEGIPDETPIDFVEASLNFLMEELEIKLLDEALNNVAVSVASLHKVVCNLSKRSAAAAVKYVFILLGSIQKS